MIQWAKVGNSKSLEESYKKGVEAFNAGRFSEAVDRFTRVLSVTPTDTSALNNRAICYRQLEKYEDALSDVSTAILIDPRQALFYSTKATILTKLHRQLEAVEELNKAIDIEPVLEYVTNKVVILKKLNKYQEALEGIEAIESKGLGSEELTLYKGTIFFEIKKFNEARAAFVSLKNPEIQKIAQQYLSAINSAKS